MERGLRDLLYWLRVDIISTVLEAFNRRMDAIRPSAVIDGVHVINFDDKKESQFYFEKVRSALELIVQYDTSRFRRIQRDMSRLTLMPNIHGGKEASYVLGAGRCLLAREIVVGSSVDLARILVHELTHARLDRVRVRQSRDRYGRLERLCMLEEVAFVANIPSTPQREAWMTRRRNAAEALVK